MWRGLGCSFRGCNSGDSISQVQLPHLNTSNRGLSPPGVSSSSASRRTPRSCSRAARLLASSPSSCTCSMSAGKRQET